MGKLRLLLALSVVATHGGVFWKFHLVDGPTAVQAFFIISGFYMSLILNEKYIGEFNSYQLFIKNRLLRLYPVYWIALLGTVLLTAAYVLIKNDGNLSIFQFFKNAHPTLSTWIFLVLTNLIIIGQDILMFTGINDAGSLYWTSSTPAVPMTAFLFVPQAWTISMELMFYLVAPFIVRKNWKFVAFLMIVSMIVRLYLFYSAGFKDDPWTYRFFPSELFFFLSGYFAYRLFVSIRSKKDKWIRYSLPFTVVIIGTVISYSFLPDHYFHDWVFPLKKCIFLVLVFLAIPFLFLAQKNQPLDRLIGELSYPVYLLHIAVIMVVSGLGLLENYPWLVIIITLVISLMVHKLVMNPVESKRQEPFRKF